MALFETIITKLVAKVKEHADFDDTNVFTYEPRVGDVEVDPFITITPSGNENEWVNNAENRRTYSFKIRVFIERQNRGNASADAAMRNIIDSLIDLFDLDYTIGGSVIMARAAPSAWAYVLGDKEYRSAEIVITCIADYEVLP